VGGGRFLAGAYGMWEDKSWGGKRCMAKFQDGGGRSEISLTSDSVSVHLTKHDDVIGTSNQMWSFHILVPVKVLHDLKRSRFAVFRHQIS